MNVRKKSNVANRSKLHCERSHAICERLHANLKQRIACDLRIANEVEMGLCGLVADHDFLCAKRRARIKGIEAKKEFETSKNVFRPNFDFGTMEDCR